jgi:hypothetical protein
LALSFAMGILLAAPGCSHAKKRTPELSKLQGKKIALVAVTGENTARRVAEVALINQLIQRGTFYLISKEDVDAARAAYSTDPSDWKGIARKAGADYAMIAKVLDFRTDENSGYSKEEVQDSQMKAETGEAKTERLYKVKSLVGNVKIELQFADLVSGEVRKAVVEKSKTVTADEREGGIHLPLRLRFLEDLCNEAFKDFFDKYQ